MGVSLAADLIPFMNNNRFKISLTISVKDIHNPYRSRNHNRKIDYDYDHDWDYGI